MQVEIEAKWLDVDKQKLRKKLLDLGANLVYPERTMIRNVFDYPDDRLQKIGGWIRVRDEGGVVTMSYKQLNERTLHGTMEASVRVDDFQKACTFLKSIGLKQTAIQETKRESWSFDGAEIEIDTWPWIPSFVEIEAKGEDNIFSVASKLGLQKEESMFGSVETVYQKYYNVTEEEVDSWSDMRLTRTPKWLLDKKRKTS